MTLILFWVKITIKRILNLFKSSPVMIIWLAVVIGAFVFAVINNYVSLSLDKNTLMFVIAFFVLFSLVNSFRNHDLMPLLIKYSKSKISNKIIYTRFFLKQAFINNLMLIIFLIAAYSSFGTITSFILFSGICVLSIMASFFIMYFKYLYIDKKIQNVHIMKKSINPLIKSALHEYITPDFLVLAALSVSLFIIIFIEFTKNNYFYEIKTQFFIFISIALSVGFLGVIDSIYNINWMFQTIISANDYKYHFKRTAFFLAGIFGLLLTAFILSGGIINPQLLLKYFFCICAILTITINIALTKGNVLFKIILSSINIILTIWISTLHAVFLFILIVPVIASYIKAKSEYREWTYL